MNFSAHLPHLTAHPYCALMGLSKKSGGVAYGTYYDELHDGIRRYLSDLCACLVDIADHSKLEYFYQGPGRPDGKALFQSTVIMFLTKSHGRHLISG